VILEQDFDKIKKVVNKIEYKEIIKDKDDFIVIDYKTSKPLQVKIS